MNRGLFLAFLGAVALAFPGTGLPAGGQKAKAPLERAEARKAFEYLNKIRKEPAKFSKEIGVDLREVMPRDALTWNDILAKVAENKALDMANRNYFDHVSPDGFGINVQIHEAGYKLPNEWVKDRGQNFFESINAGSASGRAAIQALILDKEVAGAGHRRHLLGMTDFYGKCTDIGIGFARRTQSNYRTYMCIIVARKE
jgi:uncharacterized protein YkwD